MDAQLPLVRRLTTRHHVCAASLAAGLATVCLACGNDRSPGPWAGTVDTLENGTVVVRNPPLGLWGGATPWRLAVQSRIGALEAGPAAFGHIVDLALDDLGRIWVLERQAKEIRVFTAGGRFVRRVGGSGEGPGEFEDPIGLTKGPGGHMWVMDPANARISVFDTTGAFVTGHRRKGAGYMWNWRGGFDRAGRYYDAVFTGESMALLRYDPDGAKHDTLPIPENPGEQETFVLKDAQGRSRIIVGVPFTSGTRWTLDAAGHFWYTPQSPYRIYELS
ncbi:MAG: 6-bladed beta-propeller, partial [Gemmatimonadota bacterium]